MMIASPTSTLGSEISPWLAGKVFLFNGRLLNRVNSDE